jgi:hypothetical protein
MKTAPIVPSPLEGEKVADRSDEGASSIQRDQKEQSPLTLSPMGSGDNDNQPGLAPCG